MKKIDNNFLNIFDSAKYLKLALQNKKNYERKKPFPHIHFDNFLPKKLAIILSKNILKLKMLIKIGKLTKMIM